MLPWLPFRSNCNLQLQLATAHQQLMAKTACIGVACNAIAIASRHNYAQAAQCELLLLLLLWLLVGGVTP